MAKKPKDPPSRPEQSEIKNALRSIRVDITNADIKAGNPMDPTSCAAAQAIMRTLKADEVRVHRGVTYVHMKSGWQRFKTSASMRLETIVFDRGGEFIPGEYDLQPVPLKALTKTKRKVPKSAASNHKTPRRAAIPQVRARARVRNEEGDE
jgi:hypothetical protein